MNKTTVFITFLLAVSILPFAVQAQDDENSKSYFNPLTHGVPSLGIAPDARGSGMGDVGVATEADIYSQHWNPAKYAFAYSKAGIGLTYTPWLAKLVDDMDLVYLAGYYKLGDSDRQAVSASLRYFSIGNIRLTDYNNDYVAEANPYEACVDLGYSLKFTENLSGGVALRFIYSDLGTSGLTGEDDYYPGSAVAGDLAFYYNNYLMIGNNECLLGLGLNASNIGSKISFDKGNTNAFLPTNLRIGGSLLFPMDDYNTLSLNLDMNKYMFPTPPDTRTMSTEEQQTALNEYYNTNPLPGVFQSFSDAPGGASEEFNEINWSFGAEYAYDNKFFVRGGYFYEHPNKGNLQYFSLGAGFKLNSLQIDVSYLISTVPSNPLDQTLRLSLCFDMDGLRGLMR
ncbi:MAG: type IX secretion system outer membrane channel protein PorV [Dysgonamonadaceae bacterium]|jgi:hypothetical protein|nr:type IX secretion system outer membrane channel protein PorV [Dysgonamonadaceae bacterium]